MMDAEERQVFDRIEGLPLPAEALGVDGHDEAMNRLVESWHSGRMHHAWLLSGPRGIGKASLAFSFAKFILSTKAGRTAPEKFDPDFILDPVHRQVSNGGHPELLHLTRPWDEKTKRFKSQLSIDEIRRTQSFYGMTAGAGGWRITIVDSADEMNANAANALLKILEEPPKRSLFFVLTHAAGGLLPTIRSRCSTLPIAPLPTSTVANLLTTLNVQCSDSDRNQAAQLGEGSVRRAIQLIEGSVLKDYALFEKLMNGRASGSGADWVVAHKIAESVSRRGQEESYTLFLDLVTGWIGAQVRGEASKSTLGTLAGWAEVWEKTQRSFGVANAFNLDKKQVVLSLFSNLFERHKT